MDSTCGANKKVIPGKDYPEQYDVNSPSVPSLREVDIPYLLAAKMTFE